MAAGVRVSVAACGWERGVLGWLAVRTATTLRGQHEGHAILARQDLAESARLVPTCTNAVEGLAGNSTKKSIKSGGDVFYLSRGRSYAQDGLFHLMARRHASPAGAPLHQLGPRSTQTRMPHPL